MSLQVESIEDLERVMHPYDLRSLFRAIENLRSAAPGEEDDDSEDDDDTDDTDDNDGSGGTGASDTDKGVDDPDKKRLSDEAGKHRRLRREAEQRAAKAEADLKAITDKDKSESERLQGEVTTLTEQRDALQEQVSGFAREVAISRACAGKNVSDVDMVGYFLDKDGVEFLDEDGEVADISDAVDALLRKRPALVATGGDDEDEDEDDDSKVPTGRRTTGKDKKTKKNGLDFESLASKYPALARR